MAGEDEDTSTMEVLNADQIYVLMRKEYRLSRNTRAQWYFSNLNRTIGVNKYESLQDFRGELDVVSVVPVDPPSEWDWDLGHLYKYQVNSNTMVRFLAQRYRLVYLLDLSPSVSGVDLLCMSTVTNRLLPALRDSLEGVVRPFYVPGSQLLLKPDIYVTVIAWTPFLATGTQQVLHQGWLLNSENLASFMSGVVTSLHLLEERISHVTSCVQTELQMIRTENEKMMGGLFDETSPTPPTTPTIPVASPDAGFIGMVRTGILALQLLPTNSSAGIIVVTDGVSCVPDLNACDALLNQLRTRTISLSFIQTSSAFHPHSGYAKVPYVEIMDYMACATYGAFLPKAPEVDISDPYVYDMNVYHEAFLCWSFRRALEGVKLIDHVTSDNNLIRRGQYQGIENGYFKMKNDEMIIKKKLDMTVNTNLTSLLSCRLREGYTVNEVTLTNDNTMQVKLTLQWKIASFIHYIIQASWPLNPSEMKSRIQVFIEGNYDLLHDIICQKDKTYPSRDRNTVVKKFYTTLQHLTHVDKLLVHLESFATNPHNYTVPDSVLNGIPVFCMPTNINTPVLYQPDFPYTQFVAFWTPVCSLDINIWHRWMHTHKIHILLQHDHPLPRFMLLPNSSGRYTSVQCRKAALQMFDLLKEWSTFCLLENNSYICFMYNEKTGDDDDATAAAPKSFYIIRVTSKPPCVVIWLAFPGGTPGSFRYKVLSELRERLNGLGITQRASVQELPKSKLRITEETDPLSPNMNVRACSMVSKPVERILVRYDRVPQDFFNLLEPAYISLNRGFPSSPMRHFGGHGSNGSLSGNFLTLARYLHHRRWVWTVQANASSCLTSVAVSRILGTICKQRLLEGFSFAHSQNGVQTMALEVGMKTGDVGTWEDSNKQCCIIQYVVFPPHTTTSSIADFTSDEYEPDIESSTEADGEVQIITECWVEPQDGIIDVGEDTAYLNGLKYNDVPSKMFPRDKEIIATLVTFEHINLMCHNPCAVNPLPTLDSGLPHLDSSIHEDSTTKRIPFAFDLMGLLPKSHQTVLLLSMYIQNYSLENILFHPFGDMLDGPNEKMYELLLERLARLHDREIHLTIQDNHDFVHQVSQRSTDFEIPLKPYNQPLQTPVGGDTRSPRLTSGASVTSSSTTTGETDQSGSFFVHQQNFPRWKCFVKSIGQTHVLVTFIPQSYGDLRLLLLDEEAISGKRKKVLNVVRKPCEDPRQNIPLFSSGATSGDQQSLNSSTSNLDDDIQGSKLRAKSGSDAFEKYGPKMKVNRDRAGSVEKTLGLRDRTRSIDSEMAAEKFRRSSSTRGGGRSPSDIRSRTHTCSQAMMRPRRPEIARTGSTEDYCRSPVAATPPVSASWGSLTLPIYTYDCNITGLINQVTHNDESCKPTTSAVDLLFRPEEEGDDDPPGVTKTRSHEGSASTLIMQSEQLKHSEKLLRLHCSTIQMVYLKAYVCVLFNSLQSQVPVHTYDVQNAIDYCDNESILETHINKFIMDVCGHARTKLSETRDSCDGIDDENDTTIEEGEEDVPYTKCLISLEELKKSRPCADLHQDHRAIKKKFGDILGTSFHLVPGQEDLYFFCSGDIKMRDELDGLMMSRQRRDTKDTASTFAADDDHLIEFKTDVASPLKGFRASFSDASPAMGDCIDDASVLSTFSNAPSEPSDLNETLDDGTADSVPPLFLQISVTLRYGRRVESIPLSSLPTCLLDFIGNVELESDLIDLGKLVITLDLLYFTLPMEVDLPLEAAHTERSASLSSNVSLTGQDAPAVDDIVPADDEQPPASGLPDYQRSAVTSVVEDIRWMLQDEIAFTLTKVSPITASTLELVVEHIEASGKKPGCASQSVPLYFVQRPEKSLEKFVQEFMKMEIDGFQLCNRGRFYYLLQDLAGLHSSSVDTADQLPDLERLSAQGGKYLSPVKEVQAFDTDQQQPNFWLIMQIKQDKVNLYFQYREGQLMAVLPWRQAQTQIINNIKGICKLVNQSMLLNDLFDSRLCNRLLESESSEEVWRDRRYDTNEEDVTPLEANLKMRFVPGSFSCKMVWEKHFPLHPRLKQSQGHNLGSRGFYALRMVLNAFSVNNRNNMFVYRDDRRDIFYMKVFEHIQSVQAGSLSRQPSSSSYIPRESEEFEVLSRTSSIGSATGMQRQRQSSMPLEAEPGPMLEQDRIELKVYGICNAGPNIKEDLVAVLQHKLDDKVVEVISTMLQRNPHCKLTPEDVWFMQKPNSQPSSIIRFEVDDKMDGYLKPLYYYLHQNLSNQLATIPKYTSSEHQFQDAIDSDILIYNKSSSAGGHRGIAVISVWITNKDEEPVQNLSSPKLQEMPTENIDSVEDMIDLQKTVRLEPDCETTGKVVVHFRLWEEGRVEQEELATQLEQVLEHSVWDVVTEFLVLPVGMHDVSIEDDADARRKMYRQMAQAWFENGLERMSPALQKCVINLSVRYSPHLILKEIQHQIQVVNNDFKTKVFQKAVVKDDIEFVPVERFTSKTRDSPGCTDYILISRNPSQWHDWASSEQETVIPKTLSIHQKFLPLLINEIPSAEASRSGSISSQSPAVSATPSSSCPISKAMNSTMLFIPRQRLILIIVTNRQITIYGYNCSKESFERLIKQLNNLVNWFIARSSLTTSIISQKLGLFHNQKFVRQSTEAAPPNLFQGNLSHIELLVKNHAPPSNLSTSSSKGKSEQRPSFVQTYRDVKPLRPMHLSAYSIEKDPMGKHGRQLLDMRLTDKKEILRKLYLVWQTRGEHCNQVFTPEVMAFFKQNSRIIHICYTPLLFLPKWRFEAHNTRLLPSELPRDLHLRRESKDSNSADKSGSTSSPKPLRRVGVDEANHRGLIQVYIKEYIQYLQTLGFLVIHTKSESPKRREVTPFFRAKDEEQTKRRSSSHGKPEDVYLQKSIPGGILIFEIGVCEPFFFTKLHALEYYRLLPRSSRHLTPSGYSYANNLVDECDRIKYLLHLHSFTYDFHLRTSHSFVAGRPCHIRKGFHFTSFIEDFIKYYSKGPNFARNMIFAGDLVLPTPVVASEQLFNYMLSHEKSYNFRVVRMEPLFADQSEEFHSCEFILTQLSEYNLSYSFLNDMHKSEDFDVTLLVAINEADTDPNHLRLKFYIIMTNQRELYPTFGSDSSAGQFRTVSTAVALSADDQVKSPSASPDQPSDGAVAINPIVKKVTMAIESEAVNYVGYFSSHEQSIQAVMQMQVNSSVAMLTEVFQTAMIHCRRDQLWQKLLMASKKKKDANEIAFEEFNELITLVDIEGLEKVNSRLAPIVERPLQWYQSFMRVLMHRYEEHHRYLVSSDGQTSHVVILNDNFLDAFTLVSVDLHSRETSLNFVCREYFGDEEHKTDLVQQMVEDFVETCCHHIWVEIL